MGNPREQEQPPQTHYPSPEAEADPVQHVHEEVVPPPPPYSEITGSPSTTDETPVISNPVANVNNTSSSGQPGQSGNDSANSPSQQEVHVEVNPRDAVGEEERRRACRDKWPHTTSCAFACFSSIIGIYNIGRFSMLVYLYKACFIVEFIVLTLLFGIPFLCLQMAIGQYLGSGLLDMWYISPAFKGIGFSLLYGYVILGIYTAVPISWLFVYFKDSFITSRETYKWGTCQGQFAQSYCLESQNKSSKDFIGWSVSSYFHGNVLDRNSSNRQLGDLRFEIAFNLAVVWLLVFLALSRGNRLYGKLVYAFVLIPVSLLFLVAVRIMERWGMGIASIFDAPWKEVLTDSSSWLLAAREVFLTWVLYGALCLQMCSHNKFTSNVIKNVLAVGVGVTFTLIFVSLFFASAMQAMKENNLTLVPSSYENPETVKFVQPLSKFSSDIMNITPVNLVIGECLYSTFPQTTSSGYQVLRFATEIFPATLALSGVTTISSFWSICFFMMMIVLGLAQQIALWNVVVESVIAMKPKLFAGWQTIITFICCNVGFLFGLPMTTNIGVFVVFFFDTCIGSLWWAGSIFLIMIIAILFIRGRPYGTDRLIYIISQRQTSRVWLLPILTFFWNVVLPVVFLVLSIAFVRSGNPKIDYPWMDSNSGDTYWPLWAKKLATLVQALPLLIVIVVCVCQACRYLKTSTANGALHERVEHWCCPVFATPNVTLTSSRNNAVSSSPTGGVVNVAFEDDPPPKYTPPPSYSSATARMIIKKIVRSHSMNEGKYRKALSRLSFLPTLSVTVETASGVVASADTCSSAPPSSS